MSSLLLDMLNRFRPREGWLSLILLLVAVLCLPAALHNQGDGGGLFAVGILAALGGLRLARMRVTSRPAALAGTMAGALVVLATVGRLWPSPDVLGREVGESIAWLRGVPGAAAPLSTLSGFFWQRGNALTVRLWWWGQRAAAGASNQDTIVLDLLLAALVWALCLLAGWQIYRRRAALTGLLPLGAVLAVVAFFRGGMAYFYFFAYLGCTLALVAACRLWRSRARWDATGTDYPDDMGFELSLSVAPWVTALLVLGFVIPVVQVRPLRDAFWRVMDGPWARVEQVAERFFGPIESGYPLGRAASSAGSGLPRAHLLGAGPELGQVVVLTVTTNDPPPEVETRRGQAGAEIPASAPRRYWRGITYDVYVGQGWQNSSLESQPVAANRPLNAALPAGSELVQQFELLAPEGKRIYAANTPAYLDQPVQGWWRDGGDLAELRSEVDVYTVVSNVPEPTVVTLRASSPITGTLPISVAARYLALPETVPERVLELAKGVAGQAPTRYDRAHALERYLRAYPYNRDLPQPPHDRDVVDYFLFELQEGYCDYYASAMVVMARAVGVPARLASGYAQGSYDPEGHRWVVTEENSHSWVEVYFEGIGWVEFEPTAGLPGLERPGGEQEAGPVPSLPPRALRWWQRWPWGLIVLGSTMALLLGLIFWLWRPRRALSPGELVRDRYAQLLRWGSRLRRPLGDGQTPVEYGQALGQALEGRGHGARWRQAREAATAAPDQIGDMAEAFTQVQYGPEPPAQRQAWHVRELWKRLRRHFRWLWLTTRPPRA